MALFMLSPSRNLKKKWTVEQIMPDQKKISFGQAGAGDFTLSRDEKSKRNYLKRHAPNEDWTGSGTDTAGFWSRWILWNQPTIDSSILDIEKKFGIKIVRAI